mmetsp:Transcript_15215/g.38666  ORF Transcript_15215/g.38666 Transcript_15215/m.38666 type:complete len:177 (-) Transcript_15215:521-1051(-)
MVVKKTDGSQNWDVSLCSTCTEIPGLWCMAFWCPPCTAYSQRSTLLDGDLRNYMCCQGLFCGSLCDSDLPCPQLCLCMETVFCCWCSIIANRSLIQSRYDIRNSKCENCLITTAVIFSWVWCIIQCFINCPCEADCLVDCCYCALSACMQSQQEHELRLHLARGDEGLGPHVMQMN